jgi:hypothetical protein
MSYIDIALFIFFAPIAVGFLQLNLFLKLLVQYSSESAFTFQGYWRKQNERRSVPVLHSRGRVRQRHRGSAHVD